MTRQRPLNQTSPKLQTQKKVIVSGKATVKKMRCHGRQRDVPPAAVDSSDSELTSTSSQSNEEEIRQDDEAARGRKRSLAASGELHDELASSNHSDEPMAKKAKKSAAPNKTAEARPTASDKAVKARPSSSI